MTDPRVKVFARTDTGDGPAAIREVIHAARQVVAQPYGQIWQRDFYRLREALDRFDKTRGAA